MKHLTLLTAASISLTALCAMPLTAEAAMQDPSGLQVSVPSGYNVKVITGTNPEELQAILGSLNGADCVVTPPNFPGIPNLPTPPSPPVIELPGGNEGGNDNNQGGSEETPGQEEKQGTGGTETGDQHAYVEAVVRLVNQERAKSGLKPVTLANNVQAAAQVRAKEIQRSFSHTRPDGRNYNTALQEQNVSHRGSGENIAWGQKSPEQVMSVWMNSEGHRRNIMNPNFTTIGVGYDQGSNGANYWTQLFTY